MIAAATFLSLRQDALYEASSGVFVDTRNVGSSIADVNAAGNDPARVLETQAAVARVPNVINPALKKFPSRRGKPDLFLDRSSVTADAHADLMSFSVKDPDPRLAVKLANAYANAFTAYRRELDTGALRNAQLEARDQLESLRRTGDTATSQYTDLVGRLQQLRTREVLLRETALLGRPAQAAVQVQPHPMRNGILGGMLGLLIGVGLAFMRESLNTSVRTAAAVEERLGMPLLGRIREPPKRLRGRDELSMLVTPDAPETEAFQLLATNIEFINLDYGATTFMVTSANPAEGKSTTIANLAVTFARSGKRVVLVDLDLRRPVLHRFFGLKAMPGITEVALGRAWLDDVIVKVPLEAPDSGRLDHHDDPLGGSVEMLPAGSLPPYPAEFMRSQALDDVLRRLEHRADIVLVDAPAMLAVSDAINLTPKVDAVIVLTRIPIVKRSALDELKRILDTAPVAKVGFVVTGTTGDDGVGTYGYGYGYGSQDARRAASVP
jgi:capsular exopolysaccharide synthesis family protein